MNLLAQKRLLVLNQMIVFLKSKFIISIAFLLVQYYQCLVVNYHSFKKYRISVGIVGAFII